jgi:hypothetical protein
VGDGRPPLRKTSLEAGRDVLDMLKEAALRDQGGSEDAKD